MKKRLKKWTAGIMAVTLVLLSTACSKQAEKASAAVIEEVKNGPVNEAQADPLNLWYQDDALTPYLSQAAVEFEQAKGVKVVPRLISAVDYIENISSASISQEGGPDVYIAGNDLLEKAKLAGLTLKNDRFPEIYREGNYPGNALIASSYKDELVAYPMYVETSFLLYNKNIVQTPPRTIDEILAFADQYEAQDGVENILKWNVADIFYDYFFIGNYTNLGGSGGDDKSKVTVQSDEVLKCLEYYQSLRGYFAIDPEQVTDDSIIKEFIDGKTIFTIVKTDALAKIDAAKAEGSSQVSYGVANVPDLTDTLASKTLAVTDAAVVNGYTKDPVMSSELAKFISYDKADTLYSMSGKVPVREAVAYENAEIANIMEQYKQAVNVPKIMELSNYWIEMERAFANIWRGNDISAEVKQVSDLVARQLEQ